ncbi:MAG: hypothetical protein GC204_03060 [Chloroflexi bacterium]|nr:hypothetical protein [Chloroflexota bacterium]
MSTKIKIALVVVTVVAVFAVSALSAFAQTGADPTPTPAAPGYGNYGMMGRGSSSGYGMMGFGMMWDDDAAPMVSAMVTALGLDQQTLLSELQSGKTINQIAQEQGIDPAAVTTALQKAMADHMQALVDAGVLTQAQSDARLSLMQSHWAEMPMFSGQGFGLMQGGMWGGHQRHGMMGFND